MAQAKPPRQQPSLQSLERGLAVLQVFSAERSALTLSDVARLAGITRATARRILLTLEKLGHVRSDGRLFSLTPRVLTLGWAYLSSLNIWEVAQPLMQELSEKTGESCSIATLDLPEVVNVAHVATRRIVNVALGVGLRLPVHATCMGRVLLAGLPERSFEAYLAGAELERLTPQTIVDRALLARAVQTTREQGWTLSDQELEVGLRSVAAPIFGADGTTVAAMNVFGATSRVSSDELREEFLPALLETAAGVSRSMRERIDSPAGA
jgi:IclR family transcriptional regulator, pca regulon regulatory protein